MMLKVNWQESEGGFKVYDKLNNQQRLAFSHEKAFRLIQFENFPFHKKKIASRGFKIEFVEIFHDGKFCQVLQPTSHPTHTQFYYVCQHKQTHTHTRLYQRMHANDERQMSKFLCLQPVTSQKQFFIFTLIFFFSVSFTGTISLSAKNAGKTFSSS